MMKVIVTGATSFIGTAAVRLLLQQGHQVCGVVRPGSKNLSRLWEAVPETARERLAVAELDMKEIRKLEQAPEAAGADVWLHIGWDGAGSDNRMKREVAAGECEKFSGSGPDSRQLLDAAGFCLPVLRQNTGYTIRKRERIWSAVLCRNTELPRWILADRQRACAGC